MSLKKILQSLAAFVAVGIMYALAEGNYRMMSLITSESSVFALLLKSISFGVAGIVIIIYYHSLLVKVGFVLLDMAIIFSFQYFPSDQWHNVGAFIYAPYTGLILFFMGKIITDYYTTSLKEDDEKELLAVTQKKLQETTDILEVCQKKLKVIDLKRQVTNIKRGGGVNVEERVTDINHKISELEVEINKE